MTPQLILLLLTVLIAAAIDLTSRKIPNALTYPVMIGGVILAAFAGNLGTSLAGFALGFIPGVILWKKADLGAGDVKLMSTVGLLSGAMFTVEVWLWSFIIGLAAVIVIAIRHQVVWPLLTGLVRLPLSKLFPFVAPPKTFGLDLRLPIPFGPCIAMAVFALVGVHHVGF